MNKYFIILISGVIISVIGLILIYMYITNAYIERIGVPDQSLLFWYLPILLSGILILGLGLSGTILSISKMRKNKKL
jgi:hypothetical protein